MTASIRDKILVLLLNISSVSWSENKRTSKFLTFFWCDVFDFRFYFFCPPDIPWFKKGENKMGKESDDYFQFSRACLAIYVCLARSSEWPRKKETESSFTVLLDSPSQTKWKREKNDSLGRYSTHLHIFNLVSPRLSHFRLSFRFCSRNTFNFNFACTGTWLII